MVGTILFFVAGLVVLTVGGELLVRSATRLATDLGVSRLFIGLTVVAFGTSAPEAVVSVVAAFSGSSDLAMGNVVGSNIFNVLFILGLSALITPLAVQSQLVRLDVPLLIGASVLCLLLGLDGSVGRWEGLLLFAVLLVHLTLSYRKGLQDGKAGVTELAASDNVPRRPIPWQGRGLNLVLVLVSLGLLVLGSRWLVESATTMARWLGLSELVIGLTIVAAGTSLPEVATSVVAALRGERDIAVGNVIGSCLFNLLGVLALAGVLAPDGISVAPSLLAFDLPVMVGVAVICLPIFFTGLEVSRWEGGLLLGYFALYLTYILLAASHHAALSGFVTVVTWVILPATGLVLVVSTVASLRRRPRTGT